MPRQNDYSTLIGFPEKNLFNLAFCKKFIFCKTLLFTANCYVDKDSGKFWLISHETSCLWYCLVQPICNLCTCNYSIAHLQYQGRVFLIYAHNFVNVSLIQFEKIRRSYINCTHTIIQRYQAAYFIMIYYFIFWNHAHFAIQKTRTCQIE